MRNLLLCSIAFLFAIPTIAQTPSSKYEPGTIMAVVRHQAAPNDPDQDATRYEVSVRVRSALFTVLFTPRNGANAVEYAVGTEKLVLVGNDTLTFNSGNESVTAPILRQEPVPNVSSGLDYSKAPGQYFVMKMNNLSESLSLTEDQQRQLKPIAEQESADVSAVCFTPVESQKQRLTRWKKIVRASDAKMKPFLSADQWEKLQDLRKTQTEELKQIMEQGKPASDK